MASWLSISSRTSSGYKEALYSTPLKWLCLTLLGGENNNRNYSMSLSTVSFIFYHLQKGSTTICPPSYIFDYKVVLSRWRKNRFHSRVRSYRELVPAVIAETLAVSAVNVNYYPLIELFSYSTYTDVCHSISVYIFAICFHVEIRL